MQTPVYTPPDHTQPDHTPPSTGASSASRAGGARHTRRMLLTAGATAGVVGAGALAAPYVVPLIEQRLQQAALDATLGELRQIEGISLDAALQAAELTRAAVSLIVLPVAQLVAALGSGALTALLAALDAAHNALAFLHAPSATLDALRAVVAAWQAGLSGLPIALEAYLTADIRSAEAYLRALKGLITQHTSPSDQRVPPADRRNSSWAS